jgi:hypothetical protein
VDESRGPALLEVMLFSCLYLPGLTVNEISLLNVDLLLDPHFKVTYMPYFMKVYPLLVQEK